MILIVVWEAGSRGVKPRSSLKDMYACDESWMRPFVGQRMRVVQSDALVVSLRKTTAATTGIGGTANPKASNHQHCLSVYAASDHTLSDWPLRTVPCLLCALFSCIHRVAQVSDQLLVSTNDMLLNAGAIGRCLQEMGAVVADVRNCLCDAWDTRISSLCWIRCVSSAAYRCCPPPPRTPHDPTWCCSFFRLEGRRSGLSMDTNTSVGVLVFMKAPRPV